MIPTMMRLAGATAAAVLDAGRAPLAADEFSGTQKDEIERIIKDYIISHPEVLQEAIAELDKRQAAADAEKAKAAVASNAADDLQLHPPGSARQPEGRRHDGRVLRLQLRLLQARHGRHDGRC